jgi:hypothetical protein
MPFSFTDPCAGPGVDPFWTLGVGGPTISEAGLYRVDGDNVNEENFQGTITYFTHELATAVTEFLATLGVWYNTPNLGAGNGLSWDNFATIFSAGGNTYCGYQLWYDFNTDEFGARWFFIVDSVLVWSEEVLTPAAVGARPFLFTHSADFKMTQNGPDIELRINGTLKHTEPGLLTVDTGFLLNRFIEDNIFGPSAYAQIGYGTIDDISITAEDPPALTAPNLLMPADAATGIFTGPLLNWEAVAGATSYAVEIATDAGFTAIVYSASGILETSLQVPAETLDQGTGYFWRARANDD